MNHNIKSIRVETRAAKFERMRDEWIAEAIAHLYQLKVFTPGDEGAVWNAYEVASIVFDSLCDGDGKFDFELYTPVDAINEEISYWD